MIENPELRSLLVYCGGGTFTDDDIPHRTTLTQAIFKYHEREENNIKALLAVSILVRLACTLLTVPRSNRPEISL